MDKERANVEDSKEVTVIIRKGTTLTIDKCDCENNRLDKIISILQKTTVFFAVLWAVLEALANLLGRLN